MRSVVRQAVEASQPLVTQREHRLEVDGGQKPLRVDGDAVRLVQVVSNLINNAARYTATGGHIEIIAGRDGDEAVVRVRDNGRGISPEMLESIFEMFVQEQEGDKGLGLGLTLVHSLVSLHGGRVAATSEGHDKGSQFEVRLPLCRHSPKRPDKDQPEEEEEAFGERFQVVVIDDEKDIRDSVRQLLEGWGLEVAVAPDACRGIELVIALRPDAVLLDIGMPGMDGYTAAERLRAELGEKTPRLIAMTGLGRAQDRERARRAGFDAHLTKPASPRVLRRALRKPRNATQRQRRQDASAEQEAAGRHEDSGEKPDTQPRS